MSFDESDAFGHGVFERELMIDEDAREYGHEVEKRVDEHDGVGVVCCVVWCGEFCCVVG